MKIILGFLTCAFFAFSFFVSYPRAESSVNQYEVRSIAVVDLKRIMDESLAAKTAQKEINSIKDKFLAEIKNNDRLLEKRQKELQQQKKALSEAALEKKIEEFKARINKERADAAKKQRIIEVAFAKSLQLIKDEVIKVVAEIAEEKKLDMVVPSSQLLYSKGKVDISNEVLKRLNQRLTKVNINIKPESDKEPDKDTGKEPKTN